MDERARCREPVRRETGSGCSGPRGPHHKSKFLSQEHLEVMEEFQIISSHYFKHTVKARFSGSVLGKARRLLSNTTAEMSTYKSPLINQESVI